MELLQILDFLKLAEKLKCTLRSGYTSSGRIESVTDHTWRLSLMVVLFQENYFPELDFKKLMKMSLIHDMGEAINGDIPAPMQDKTVGKNEQEKVDFLSILSPLSEEVKSNLLAIWEEYEAASTEEAKLVKALDKIETILQHNQGDNPPDFDYTFNLEYGKKYAAFNSLISDFREIIDKETLSKIE